VRRGDFPQPILAEPQEKQEKALTEVHPKEQKREKDFHPAVLHPVKNQSGIEVRPIIQPM